VSDQIERLTESLARLEVDRGRTLAPVQQLRAPGYDSSWRP
jgi:hypothetical protein